MAKGTFAVKSLCCDGAEKELNRDLSLREMQEIVGGLIQIVPSNIKDHSLVVNDEGMLLRLPRNEKAYALLHPNWDWRKVSGHDDFCIFGNAILIRN